MKPPSRTVSSRLGLAVVASIFLLPSAFAGAEALNPAKQLIEARKFSEAEAAIAKVAAAEPENAEAAMLMGQMAMNRKDGEAAVRWMTKATQLDPSRGEYFRFLGFAHLVAAQEENEAKLARVNAMRRSIGPLSKAIELDPDDLEARRVRSGMYAFFPWPIGGKDKALDDLLEIRKRNREKAAKPLCRFYSKTGRFPEAFAVCEEMLQAHPEEKQWNHLFGELASKAGQHMERGEALLREYLVDETLPEHVDAHCRLAKILERKGNAAEAHAEYRAALVHDPEKSRALNGLKELDPSVLAASVATPSLKTVSSPK